MCGLMWVFCEWANKIKARKFVPQQCFLSIYSHHGQTLASYLGSRFLYSLPTGEVSLKRPSAGNIGKPIYG